MDQIARNPKQVRRAARPLSLEPEDERYVNLDDIRGYNLRTQLEKELYIDPDDTDTFAHIVYAGHRGNGKTTELKKLMDKLSAEAYLFAYKDAHGDLGASLGDYTDLMLYLAQIALERVSQEVRVDEALIEPVLKWFEVKTKINKDEYESKMTVAGKSEVGFSIPGLLKLITTLTAKISGGHKSVEEIRLTLKNTGGEFISRLNDLFAGLRQSLRAGGKPDQLVLVADSLDRYHPEMMDKVFSRAAGFFERLDVHMILTLPLALVYAPKQERVTDWGFASYVLPMPMIRKKDQSWDTYWPEGVARLKEIIHKRVDVDQVFGKTREDREQALLKLVLNSGGSLRELMHLLTEAAKLAWDVPIEPKHVEMALHHVRRDFLNVLEPKVDLPILHDIHQNKRASERGLAANLFFYRLALEYNGEGWADVHPLVHGSEIFWDLSYKNKKAKE